MGNKPAAPPQAAPHEKLHRRELLLAGGSMLAVAAATGSALAQPRPGQIRPGQIVEQMQQNMSAMGK